MRRWQTLSQMFQQVRSSHLERASPPTFLKRSQEEQLNKKLTTRFEEMKKQAGEQMNYSLGVKNNPLFQREDQSQSGGSPFSLSSVLQNVQTVFQNLVGSFVGGLRRLGFGFSKLLGAGTAEPPPQQPPEAPQTTQSPKQTIIDTSSMSPSELAFQRQRAARLEGGQRKEAMFRDVEAPSLNEAAPTLDQEQVTQPISQTKDSFSADGVRSEAVEQQALRDKLGLSERKTARRRQGGEARIATTGGKHGAAPTLFEAAADFLGGIVSSVQNAARAVVDKAKQIGQRVQEFVADVRENGLRPVFEAVKQRVSSAIEVLTNPQRVTASVSRAVDRVNSALGVVPKRVRSMLAALNDRLYGINRKDGKARSAAQESHYWKDLTGLTKSQFMLALRKDRDRWLQLGSVSAKGIDFNAASGAAKQGKGSSASSLANIKFADIFRGNFGGVFELRMVLAQRIAERLVEGPLMGQGKFTGRLLERTVWLQELLATRQTALNQNIVKFHEAFITGTTFAEVYKETDSWKQRYFSPEGTGRSYSEQHDSYEQAILQKYFNMALFSSSLFFTLLLLRRWTRPQVVDSATTSQPTTSPHPDDTIDTHKELLKLRLEVEKLKLERQLLTTRQAQ